MLMRTDANNNPTAFTSDVAKEAGLKLGVDYNLGQAFIGGDGRTYHTAHLLGDPIAITIRVIDSISFDTSIGTMRWTYIAIPKFIWALLTFSQKRDVIGWMYQREGGTEMRSLFPNYGKL
jgi:hypothetical protein